jgi:hypothetical protein
VSAADIRSIGGDIIADGGRVGLSQARALAEIFAGLVPEFAPDSYFARFCREQSKAYRRAAASAARWRRAAGWKAPERADQA